MANKTAYKPKSTPETIKWMVRSGLTNLEISEELGIAEKTLYNWRTRYSQVAVALSEENKDIFDATVEKRMYHNATGMTLTDVKVTEELSVSETGEPVFSTVKKETTVREVPPNVIAQIFWLKNRRPKRWRDKHEVDLSGDITIKPPSRPEEFFPACPDCNGSGHVTHLENGKEIEIECSTCRGDGYVDPI